MGEVDSADLVADRGIVGDRYFDSLGGTWSTIKPKNDRQISIVSLAEIQGFNRHGIGLDPGQVRRNVLVDGPDLAVFMHKRFFLGNTVLITNRYSYACGLLQQRLDQPRLIELTKADKLTLGIHCQILYSGKITIGDTIRLPKTPEELEFIYSDAVAKPKSVIKHVL